MASTESTGGHSNKRFEYREKLAWLVLITGNFLMAQEQGELVDYTVVSAMLGKAKKGRGR